VDLLKALRADETFSDPKVGALFDACAGEFAGDPHFNLHYAINLQYRDTEESIRKGLERLVYAEGFLERRNHRLTHRRAVLNFRLAQMLHEAGRGSEAVEASTGRARELFEIKLIEDPFSSYSFLEYLRFEIWCLEHVAIGDGQRARAMAKISDLFDKAQRRLLVDRDKVASIEASYRSRQRTLLGGSDYADYIQRLYGDPDLKPYALILRYYQFAQQQDTDGQGKVVKELEAFTQLDEVVKLLFGFYGRNLYLADHRVKLFDLVRKHDLLLRQERAHYHYFMAVAAAYNRRFHDFYEHLNSIRAGVGPGLRVQEVWRNADGEHEVFSGRPFKQKGRKLVRVVELQRYFPIWKRGSVSDVDFSGARTYSVILKFSLTGIWAILDPGA